MLNPRIKDVTHRIENIAILYTENKGVHDSQREASWDDRIP